jgi:hypothetical protein
MQNGKTLVWLGVGFLSALLLSDSAFGDSRRSHGESHRDVQRGRAELRQDFAELRRDRAELRSDVRRGASRHEIARGKSEIRRDVREIERDRRELRRDRSELRRDWERFGYDNHGYSRGRKQDSYGWWNNGDRWGRARSGSNNHGDNRTLWWNSNRFSR